jgi:hypothetical protein
LDFDLSAEQNDRLTELSKPDLGYPNRMYGYTRSAIQFNVTAEPRSFRG